MDNLLLIKLLLVMGITIEARVLFTPKLKINKDEIKIAEKFKNICYTDECKSAAAYLARNLNLSVDPCTNFFEFACGGWIKSHPVPKTESHWNQFNLVDDKLNLQLKDILELAISVDDPLPVRNAKRFYKVCMDGENLAESDYPVKELVTLLNTYGGWPIARKSWKIGNQFNWSEMVADVTRKLAVWPILYVSINGDRKNSSRQVITIDQPSVVVPRIMLADMETYKEQIDAYVKWVRETASNVARVAGQRVDPATIKKQAEEIVQFEIEIAKIMSNSEMRRNVLRTYNAMTLRELQAWTDNSIPNQINWLVFIKRIFDNADVNIDWDRTVIVREVDYLFKMVKLVSQTPKKILANYIHWRIVKLFSRELNNKMRKLAFDFEQVFTGATMDQPRWKECMQSADSALSMAIGYVYVKKYFDNDAKKAADEMTANIKAVFSEQMDHLSWMDEQTKQAAKIKVDKMTQLIGYPFWYSNKTALEEYYHGLIVGDSHLDNVKNSREFNSLRIMKKLNEPTERTEWPISPGVVNAYYNSQTNSIIFPAGILQPPFFGKQRTEALNYGGIGVVIGHEITHGFDDVGRHSDAQGNLAQWWSEETIKTYLDKSECFIKQYGSYRLPILDSTLHINVTVNGVTTLGENIADNGGLHSALLAYRKYVARHGTEPRLPGLETFSPEQLFFIAFATNWCESATKESLLHEVLNDPHSPHKFRVEGSLENSQEFTKVFNCAESKVKKERCTIW